MFEYGSVPSGGPFRIAEGDSLANLSITEFGRSERRGNLQKNTNGPEGKFSKLKDACTPLMR
jgi:hypothetical protein